MITSKATILITPPAIKSHKDSDTTSDSNNTQTDNDNKQKDDIHKHHKYDKAEYEDDIITKLHAFTLGDNNADFQEDFESLRQAAEAQERAYLEQEQRQPALATPLQPAPPATATPSNKPFIPGWAAGTMNYEAEAYGPIPSTQANNYNTN